MAGHDLDTLFRALKAGTVERAYYLHGPEHQLKDEAVQAILDVVLDPGLRDFNLDLVSAATLDPAEIDGRCRSLPMMADRRAVVIRDVEAWNRKGRGKTAVLAYLERPAPETVLILVQTGDGAADADLAKRTHAVDLAPLPPDRAARWVERRAAAMDLSLTPEAVHHLVQVLEGDLGAIASELCKVAGLAESGSIGVDRIESLLGVRHGETQEDWRDAVMDRDFPRAAALLGPVLQQPGVSGVRLVTLLGTSLIGVGLARSLRDGGKRGRTLENAVFNAIRSARLWGVDYRTTTAAWTRWAERWPLAAIHTALREARWADEALKSTTLSGEEAIILDLVLRIQGIRQAAA